LDEAIRPFISKEATPPSDCTDKSWLINEYRDVGADSNSVYTPHCKMASSSTVALTSSDVRYGVTTISSSKYGSLVGGLVSNSINGEREGIKEGAPLGSPLGSPVGSPVG
jgi:hypothetical protein